MLGQVLTGLAIGLAITWVVFAVVLVALRPRGLPLRALARVVPQSVRLVAALYRDPNVPRSFRWRLRVAFLYNIQPINLIPDFVPVIGFADNAIVLCWALRSTVRVAGTSAVEQHWSGSREGLVVLYRAMRLQRAGPGVT